VKQVPALALAIAIVPSSVLAQPAGERGGYTGASIGYARVYFSDNTLFFPGATSVSKDETDTAYRLYAGYRLHRHFALEGGWTRLGEFSFTRTVPSLGSATGTFKASGWFAAAVGIVPLEKVSLFGKAGVIRYSAEKSLSTTGSAAFAPGTDLNPKSTGVDWVLGAGAGYAFSNAWGARLDYDVYKVGDDKTGSFHIYVVSLGATYRF